MIANLTIHDHGGSLSPVQRISLKAAGGCNIVGKLRHGQHSVCTGCLFGIGYHVQVVQLPHLADGSAGVIAVYLPKAVIPGAAKYTVLHQNRAKGEGELDVMFIHILLNFFLTGENTILFQKQVAV